MIDIENEVFNTVANALRASYNGISVYGEEVESPSSFPSVSILEGENTESLRNATLLREPETACTLMYSVNIYSNLKAGKKAQAKGILKVIDEQMHSMGFIRDYGRPVPNLLDRTIYRIVAQYTRTYQTF